MKRVIVIVARERHDLYEYFKQGFAGLDAVEVVLDRRVMVARGEGGQPPHAERRRDIDTYDELVLRGFLIRTANEVSR
jgi:hypothetical protein